LLLRSSQATPPAFLLAWLAGWLLWLGGGGCCRTAVLRGRLLRRPLCSIIFLFFWIHRRISPVEIGLSRISGSSPVRPSVRFRRARHQTQFCEQQQQ